MTREDYEKQIRAIDLNLYALEEKKNNIALEYYLSIYDVRVGDVIYSGRFGKCQINELFLWRGNFTAELIKLNKDGGFRKARPRLERVSHTWNHNPPRIEAKKVVNVSFELARKDGKLQLL